MQSLTYKALVRAKIEKNTLCGRALVRFRAKIEKTTFLAMLWLEIEKKYPFSRALVIIRSKIENNTLSGRALFRIRAKIQ